MLYKIIVSNFYVSVLNSEFGFVLEIKKIFVLIYVFLLKLRDFDFLAANWNIKSWFLDMLYKIVVSNFYSSVHNSEFGIVLEIKSVFVFGYVFFANKYMSKMLSWEIYTSLMILLFE